MTGRSQKPVSRSQKSAKTGLTQKVREAARGFGREFTAAELKAALDVRTYRECRYAVGYVIKDLRRAGEIEAVSRGVYRYLRRQRPRGKMDVIWHLVRSHRHFTTDEIERLSGAARATVLEYLQCLKALGHIRQARRGGAWLMISDPGPETPANTAKCEKLRKLRNGAHK